MIKAIVLHTHVAGLGVIRALSRMGIPVVGMHYEDREVGYLSKHVTEKILVPHPETEERDFIACLLNYGHGYSGSILIPTNDFTVSTVSRHKERLEQHYIVAVPSWEITKKVLIKKYTYEIADAVGIPYPRTFVPKSIDEFAEAQNRIDYPFLIKPCEGHRFFETFGTKMFEVNNEEQALFYFTKARAEGFELMIQEIIPGDDTNGINYNSYFVDDEPIAEFTARKVRLDPPCFGSPRVLVSQPIPEIIEVGRTLLRAIGFYGFSCMEFKKDVRDGVYKLMEVNGRHNLTTSLAVRCGINFPWIMYQHLCQNKIIIRVNNFETNVYWIDICKDGIHSFFSRKYENFSFSDYIRPYLSSKVFAVFSVEDVLPILKRTISILMRMYRLVVQRLKLSDLKIKIRDFIVGKAY